MKERLTIVSVASLQHLGLLDLVLYVLLLDPPLLCIPPPYWALILASHAQVDAGPANRMSLIALLSTEATGKAALIQSKRLG